MTCRWDVKSKLASLLLGVACLASLAACRQEAGVSKAPTPVRTAEVQLIDAATSNTYSANIQPYQQVDLSFKSNGYLASIKQVKDADGHVRNIDIGDYVEWSGENLYNPLATNEAYKFMINYIVYGMTH